ncbi:hypothetical protein [Streptomyces sp. NPDC008121]|uniref:hypothetical protein n=1 Tax=Streptomyces sp. NPDC008121 TaxID=3364809 RepID=UPI0036EDCCAA
MGLVSESASFPGRNRTSRRRGRVARATAGFAVLLAVVAYVAVHYVIGGGGPARCSVGTGENTYEFTPEQAANAATISAVGTTRGMPERAVTIALATALQESALRNIAHGDRDSLGLFQQRPSQGWGTAEQILDPVYSSGKFYEGLEKVPGYSRLPLTVAAQKVQRSGFPQAYAKHEPDAALLAAALTGRSAAALSCTTGPARDGLPGDPVKVRAELVRDFGEKALPQAGLGGAGSAGARAGAGPAELAVPVRAAAGSRERRGWELAHWAVARADGLRVVEVAYAGKVWRAGEALGGWSKTGDAPSGGAEAASGTDSVFGSVRIRLAQ